MTSEAARDDVSIDRATTRLGELERERGRGDPKPIGARGGGEERAAGDPEREDDRVGASGVGERGIPTGTG